MTGESGDADGRGAALGVDEAFVCAACGRRWYYTRERCPDCGGAEASTYALGEGELLAVTVTHVTPPDVRSPNALGLARFGDVRLIAQLTDADAAPGDRVTFGGAHRLRDGDARRRPRLVAVESP